MALTETKNVEKEEETLEQASGYYYIKDTGEYAGLHGSGTDVYICSEVEKTKNVDEETKEVEEQTIYKEAQKLDITHSDFCYCAYVILKEAAALSKIGKPEHKNECVALAFASYNRAQNAGKTHKRLLASSFSSVSNKKELVDTDKTDSANNARLGMIHVYNGENDITDGAEYWDGYDFLAWGDSERKYDSSKKGHNKFDEYKFVEIPKDIYDSYLEKVEDRYPNGIWYTKGSKHSTTDDEGSHTHKKVKGVDKINYPIPAGDFSDTDNWHGSYFYYEQEDNTAINGISATVTYGGTIFWKILKDPIGGGKVEKTTTTDSLSTTPETVNDTTTNKENTEPIIFDEKKPVEEKSWLGDRVNKILDFFEQF